MTPADPDFDLLVDAVQGAGAVALHYFKRKYQVWEKSKNDPVSEADFAVNRYLKARLEAARPDYGWLSEENEDDPKRLTRSHVWVIDPIDGTRAFIGGTADFSVSAALVVDGKPLLGAVLRPLTGDLFAASQGGGARLNDELIMAKDCADLSGARMVGDEGYFRSRRIWPMPWPEIHCEACNSIALRLCLVAAGMADAAVTLRAKNDWDMAAADLILSEAGGVLNPHLSPHVYNSKTPKMPLVVASNPAIADAVMQRVDAAIRHEKERKTRSA